MSLWRKRFQGLRPYLVPSLVFLVVIMAICWRLWTPIPSAKRTFWWDAVYEYWGDLQFQFDAYRSGELPLWNPFDRTGYPFYGDPQAGLLYPVTWLFLALCALFGGAFWWVIAIKTVLHFWIGSVGMYAYLRRRGLPVPACYAGGLVFLISYAFMHNLFMALNWSIAWAPWMLMAADAWTERPSVRRGALLALALAMGFLAGAMATYWYSLIILVPYATWAIVRTTRQRGREYLWAIGRTSAVALLLFVGMAAAQLIATGELLPQTVRAVRDLDFIGHSAFGPDDLFSYIVPRMPGENCYIGVATFFWVATALTLLPSGRQLLLGATGVLGALCALGKWSFYLPILASAVVPFSFFRASHRYNYVVITVMAILGAEGLARLASLATKEERERVTRVILGAGAICVLIFGIGFVTKAQNNQGENMSPLETGMVLALCASLFATWVSRQVVVSSGRRQVLFLYVAAFGLAVDLGLAQSQKIDMRMKPFPNPKHDHEIAELAGVPLEARVFDRDYLQFRPGVRRGIRDLGGYQDDPLSLSRYAILRDAVQSSPRQLGHASVRYLLEAGMGVLQKSPADNQVLKAIRNGVFELPEVAPSVLWVDKATVIDGDEKAALKALLATKPGTAAILEKKTLNPGEVASAEEGEPSTPPVPGKIVEYKRNRVVFEVDAPANGIVVLSEAYYPKGWTAKVDGKDARIFPANATFRGILVEGGTHRIEMEFRAPKFLALSVVSIISFFAAVGIALGARKRKDLGGVVPEQPMAGAA
ncbi:MAG: YfhO family protein [Deltaproteobacteria bacterium]|nr:YfhO family protein [Deltaproteobacteria bacterium]